MDNAIRRDILARAKATGYTGSITEAFQAYDQGRDLVQEYVQQQQVAQPQMQVAQTPQEQGQGLRPYHEQGQINQSMAFPNVQPGQSFNTMGMKVPINIDKIDNQGNLVESYKAVPPGIANLPTGPYEGTVIESPARMQTGGPEKRKPMMAAEKLPEDIFPYEGTSAMFKDERYNTSRAKELYEEDESGHLPSIDYETGEWLKAKRYPTSWKEFNQYALNPEVNALGFPTENSKGYLKYPNYQKGGIRKYQTAGLEEEDTRTLESGTIVDKGTNTLNIVKDGKITKTFPVLTGQAGKNPKTDVNKNVGSLDDLETNSAARSTPTGTYMMARNPDIYGWPGYDLNPIPAFGQSAPAAEETAVHITYGASPKPGSTLEGHPDPAEFKRRNAAYKKDSSMRYLSYGCTNAQGEAINCLEQTFPQGDTAIYVDSRFNRDSSFLNKFRNQETPTPEVIEEPMIVEYPKSKPIDYKFDPEFGTIITNPIEVKPKEDRSKFKSKAKKKETGGISTTAETAMYEWRSGLSEDSRKRYIKGGLKNRVLYNKAKYKR
jgi:uncharacterized membrane protein (UPF0127 family)